MSTQAKTNHNYSLEEYFDLEATSGSKHEYWDGAIFAMVGASLNHNIIAGNLFRKLGNALEEKSCRVFTSAMRVRTPNGLYTYPDISVVCGEIKLTDDDLDTLANPTVLVEVLSKSTARYDRSGKFEMYQTIDCLSEYVLIEQREISVEQFVKDEQGAWRLAATYKDTTDDVAFSSLGIGVPLLDIYHDVEF